MVARRWQLLIGWSELLAGLGGLLMAPLAAYHNAIQARPIYYVGAGVVFAVVAATGWFLKRGNQFALRASRWIQVAQVLQLTTACFTYEFTVGLQLLVVIGAGQLGFSPGANAGIWIGPPVGDPTFRLGLNLFPIVALWGLRPSKPISGTSTIPEAPAEGTA